MKYKYYCFLTIQMSKPAPEITYLVEVEQWFDLDYPVSPAIW